MMETTQRGKKRVNKRSNVDKFNENIGPAKSMKDKIKSEKSTLMHSVDGVKAEPNLEVDFKKEPVLNNPICENESKNSNICSKTGDVKCIKSGLMDSVNVNKIQDRPFLDAKTDIGSRPEDASEEDDLQANLMSSKIKGKLPSDANMFATDSNESLILGLCNQNLGGPPNSGPGLEQPGVQPLPSNVINKQPGTMEAQYMQQQSQIFVFTTALANKSAESVLQGQYPSIIAYHCAQPGTKKYLEKHPLKLNQFHRQSSAQWLNNLAHIKQKAVFGSNAHVKPMGQIPMAPRLPGNITGPCDMPQGPGSGPGPGPGPGPRTVGSSMQGPVSELEGMNEQNEMPPNTREIGDHRHGEFPGGINPMNHINMWNQGNINQNNMSFSGPMKNMDREKPCVLTRPPLENINSSHFPGVSQLTLTGTKVPTENLTPQQRQHRAEQLATLRKMQEILFPENQAPPTDEFGNPRIVTPGNINPSVEDSNRNNDLDNSDMKNQIGLKNVNSSNLNSNPNNSNSNCNNNINNSSNTNSSNNNGNNCSGSSNIINNNGNNGNASGNNSNSSNNSNNNNSNSNNNNNCNNNSPINRLMGRNMSGQSNRNIPLDTPMNHSVVNPPNAVLDISESIDSLQEQNSHAVQKMSGGNAFPSVAAQLEWQKHYQQFQEEQKKNKGSRTDSPVSRGCNKMQGPPPPYHQTTRSASVPIAVPSPNPGSPSNTTSNLSLPSPRTSSDLNSPSDINKHASGGSVKISTCSPPNNQGSPSCSKVLSNNPDTPISTSASQSPTPTPRKESSQPPGLDFSSKDLFSRTASSLTQQKHQKQQNVPTNKEPNLMPVPSPQQIHYLNTFEGQELTIQKQPNTSLKETTINSPLNHTPLSETPKCKTPNGAASSPLSQVPDTSPRFSNIVTSTGTTCTTPVSTQSQTSIPTSKDTTTVPSSPDTAGPSPCRSENLPLNPNGMNCPQNNKSMHFDPITSLAQMSQQLTSQTAPPCPGGGPMMYNSSSMHMVGNLNHMEQHVMPVGPGGSIVSMGHENPPMENMQFSSNNPIISCAGPMMDMPPGFMNTSSPKQNMGNPPPRCVAPFGFGGNSGPGFQKMMGPNTYNGMNVQVKASTPNTIQYLPARPNANSPNANSRGPPSLDFLQRFTNPMNNLDSKVSFIPNCHSNSMEGVNSGGNPGNPINCGGPVNNSSGNLMPNSVPNMLLGGNMVLNSGPVGSLRGQLRAGPGGMMKVPQLGGGGPGGPVFPPSPACDPMIMGPGGNSGMFIQGSKSSPLGMPPDASQPLPPSMSQGNNFKNSPFVGPTVADPNYAQQFHNFQQQLYATNTRSHQMNSHMNQSYFLPK